jgi:GT2 family glycosyltransferase
MSIATKIIKNIREEKGKGLVSIIVPIYNKIEFTMQMLSGLFENTKTPYEIIIIDNNSVDASEKVIKEFFKSKPEGVEGVYIKNPQNQGYSIANNQGARVAKGEMLCFLNNDTIPLKGWLEGLVGAHKAHKAGITGAKLIIPGQGIIQHAGIDFDEFKYPVHINYGLQRDAKEVSEDKEYKAVTGACLLVDKKNFLNMGGFDEGYWLGWEDIDLCNRFRKAGYHIWYASKSELYHYESMSEGRYSKETDNWYKYSKKWVFETNK